MDFSELKDLVDKRAVDLGIDCVGFTTPSEVNSFLNKYYTNQKHIEDFFLNAKLIISGALSYNYDWNNEESEVEGYIARYTTANFYKLLRTRLISLAKYIKEISKSKLNNKTFFKVYVNSAVNDKLIAYASGLGSFYKNSVIGVGESGCKYVLGSILIDLELDVPPAWKLESTCGNCKLCSVKCPTGALNTDMTLDKDICLQHLSSEYDWPDNIVSKWGKRFFGCSNCIDVCPKNKNSRVKYDKDEFKGFVGTSFDMNNIFNFKKGDYKFYFASNQISAGWIDEILLVRNIFVAFYNMNRHGDIQNYIFNVCDYGWSEEEVEYIKKFAKKHFDL